VRRRLYLGALTGLMFLAGPLDAAKPPTTWDGLVQVSSKRLDLLYLQPGANFGGYTKVLIEPTEVAFHKDWSSDYNSTNRSPSSRISDRQLEEAIDRGVMAAGDIFARAWTTGGYEVVDQPGPDVLRVQIGIVNIRVSAPDRPSAGRSYQFANEAGSATLFIEARDSITGALLGRAVDQGVAGDNVTAWRTSVTNRADFRELIQRWANTAVRGMAELKLRSPIQP